MPPNRLRILLVHNHYQWPGGEDEVFSRERQLLTDAGHEVIEYTRHNNEITHYSPLRKASLALRTVWAWDSYRDLRRLLQEQRPDLAHFHNTFPLVSPAAYHACAALGVPVVQGLHNSRLLCPISTFQLEGRPCQSCLGRIVPWPVVQHGCYRGSRLQSAAVASMLSFHRCARTWHGKVDVYVVATEFYRSLFIQGGLPASRIVVKPHFIGVDPGPREGTGSYALFIGRLATEKGVPCLLKAWNGLKGIPLKIRGEGPLADKVRVLVESKPYQVELLPRLSHIALTDLIKGARFLVWPSEGNYENFGLVAIEAFACGVPVIASHSGVGRELVDDGRTGLHFKPGDPGDLAAKAAWAWEHHAEMAAMGRNGRAEFEAKYTAKRNYPLLMNIYQQAINCRASLHTRAKVPGTV